MSRSSSTTDLKPSQSSFVLVGDSHLLDKGKVVGCGVLPIDQPYGGDLLAGIRLDLRAITEQIANLAVGVADRLTTAKCHRFIQLEP